MRVSSSYIRSAMAGFAADALAWNGANLRAARIRIRAILSLFYRAGNIFCYRSHLAINDVLILTGRCEDSFQWGSSKETRGKCIRFKD